MVPLVSALAGACALLALGTGAQGSLITAVGTVESVSGGEFDGWYKYTYDVTWDLSKGLSHLDLIFKPGCAQPDHLFAFAPDTGEANDGVSTDSHWHAGDPLDMPIEYQGSVSLTGDPSIGLDAVLVKWEPSDGSPGKQGAGTFWFYSNVIPEYGTYSDILIAKNGRNVTYGDMEGAWPSCSVTPPHTPEPATFGLLLVGMMAVAARRRRA